MYEGVKGRRSEKWPTLAPRTILTAHATFPASRFDAEQFLNLLTADGARREDEIANIADSELINLVRSAGKKRRGQGAVAGLTALSYILLKQKGISPSLEKASALTSELCYTAEYGALTSGEDHVPERTFTLIADPANVKKIFRRYRCVSHIWAAELCMSKVDADLLNDLHDLTYPESVMNFQRRIEGAADTSAWGVLKTQDYFDGIEFGDWQWNWNWDFDWGSGPKDLLTQSFETLLERGAL